MGLQALSMTLGFAEGLDPYFGHKHLILDFQYVYLKRAPKIHNRHPICNWMTEEVPWRKEPLPDKKKCPHHIIKPNHILRNQGSTSGARVTASLLWNKYTTWEARMQGYFKWYGAEEAYCKGALQFPFQNHYTNTVDWTLADRMKGKCDTAYWGAEANYWNIVTPRRVDFFSVSWLFGLRYVNLVEWFRLTALTTELDYTSSSNYKIKTKNRAAGFQIGGDIEGNLGYNFTYGVVAKAGALLNFAENDLLFRDINNTRILQNYNHNDFNLTFLGEIEPFLLFNLTKHVLFKFSYELTYLSNIALAMNQINFEENDPSENFVHVDIGGYFMVYGAYVGLGFDF